MSPDIHTCRLSDCDAQRSLICVSELLVLFGPRLPGLTRTFTPDPATTLRSLPCASAIRRFPRPLQRSGSGKFLGENSMDEHTRCPRSAPAYGPGDPSSVGN
jgi:hypothetical protein